MKRIFGILLIVLLVVIAAGYWLKTTHWDTPNTTARTGAVNPSKGPSGSDGAREFSMIMESEEMKADEERTNHLKMFQTDAAGNLVLNEKTRLSIEYLHALNTPEELRDKLHDLSSVLPAPAHAQLVEYISSYNRYILALKRAFSPGQEMKTVDEMIARLPAMHDLRIKHFGADAAEAFFGQEEMVNQQLLNVMLTIDDDSLTLEQKADKAYERLTADPDLLKADNPYRRKPED